jgi:GNAT superfamily N-acetyltransferase
MLALPASDRGIASSHGLETQAHLRFAAAMATCRIRSFEPDDRDWLVEKHRVLYAASDGFDASFGELVGRIIDGFLAGSDPACEAGWVLEDQDRRLGTIFCCREDELTARLRMFFLVPEMRGQGARQAAFAALHDLCPDTRISRHDALDPRKPSRGLRALPSLGLGSDGVQTDPLFRAGSDRTALGVPVLSLLQSCACGAKSEDVPP